MTEKYDSLSQIHVNCTTVHLFFFSSGHLCGIYNRRLLCLSSLWQRFHFKRRRASNISVHVLRVLLKITLKDFDLQLYYSKYFQILIQKYTIYRKFLSTLPSHSSSTMSTLGVYVSITQLPLQYIFPFYHLLQGVFNLRVPLLTNAKYTLLSVFIMFYNKCEIINNYVLW